MEDLKDKFICDKRDKKFGNNRCTIYDNFSEVCLNKKCSNYASCSICQNYFNFNSTCKGKCKYYKKHPDYTLNKDPRNHNISQEDMDGYVKKILEN
ncbi:hypothetical protein [uncultured Clostridium sp.]|uniref:hypothetical protein n=1 Tax=uncultured Clostridium sp. TaxID=59620 RepID=UPI00263B31C7|nr:hypothetical protein [uncultured Clostridium sp.]